MDILPGQRDREIQIFVDPSKLAARGVTVEDVANAVKAQNMELPAGFFGSGARELTVKTKGEVKSASEVADIVINSLGGSISHLIRHIERELNKQCAA